MPCLLTVFGENAFALRLPSALSVGLSALMIFLLVRRFSGRETAALLAPAIFLTCPLVLAMGHITVLDSLLSMLLTGAMVCFFFSHMAENRRRKNLYLVFMGIFCGMAFLTKGFLAFAVPVLAVVPFLLWEGRFKEIIKVPWIPMLTAFLIVLAVVPDDPFSRRGVLELLFLDGTYRKVSASRQRTASKAYLVFSARSGGWRAAMGHPGPGRSSHGPEIRNEESAHAFCLVLVSLPFSLLFRLQRQTDPLYPSVLSSPCHRSFHRACRLL